MPVCVPDAVVARAEVSPRIVDLGCQPGRAATEFLRYRRLRFRGRESTRC